MQLPPVLSVRSISNAIGILKHIFERWENNGNYLSPSEIENFV